MNSRKPQTNLPAGHGDDYEYDLSKTFRYMTIDPRAEGTSHTAKFIGGFSNNFPKVLQTPQKDARPSPPSLRPANARVLRSRRQPSGMMVFPVPMHDFTPNREGSGQ